MNYDPLAALYDAQYARYRDDLPFYTRLADDYGSPVLELGAGSARVSAALARAGHEVVGIELSKEMLTRARARLEHLGLKERVQLHKGDMRSFELGQAFPLIIAPFNTFMHAYTPNDQDTTLAAVKRHLAPGGLFALDLFNPNFNELNVLRREAEWRNVGGPRSELFLLQTHDPNAQLIETRYYLDTVAEDGTLKRQITTLRQRYFTRFELERALRTAGFEHLQFFGHFDRRHYRTAEDHLICLAR